ncbi:MAG: hypothetical protein Q7K45_02860 [Nanoarchaeota archaeon]|nr:hypothetical protein [Nanoarchaeota archaeon]
MINVVEILKFMGELGVLYEPKTLPMAFDYVSDMLHDHRIVEIRKDGTPHAIIFFSVCNDYEPYLKKGEFEYLPDNPSGKIIYVEVMIARRWTRELREKFEELLATKYPNFEYGVWHRMASWGDRKVIAKRRLQHVL